jgi:hypothetical protein
LKKYDAEFSVTRENSTNTLVAIISNLDQRQEEAETKGSTK